MLVYVSPVTAVLLTLTKATLLLAFVVAAIVAIRTATRTRRAIAAVALVLILTAAARADEGPIYTCSQAWIDQYCGTQDSGCRTFWEWYCWFNRVIY